MASKIDDLNADLGNALEQLPTLKARGELPPELNALAELLCPQSGQHAEVALYRDGRKVRSNASADYWDLRTCEVRIAMRPAAQDHAAIVDSREIPHPSPTAEDGDPTLTIIKVLAEAECRPGMTFVALTWLRDTLLPSIEANWTQDPQRRQDAIKVAIDGGWIIPSKVTNPKNPQFPTTAVRVNRADPLGQKILSELSGYDEGFSPIVIRGKPLSQTVLEDRR